MSIVAFSKISRFQEYEVVGITDRSGEDYILVSLTLRDDPDNISIPCALKRGIRNEVSIGQIVSARLAFEATITSRYGAPPSYKVEAIKVKQTDRLSLMPIC